jgi:hypothetical protein
MEWNITTIGILLLVFFAGYGIGLLEMRLKYSAKLRRADEAVMAARTVMGQKPAGPGGETNTMRLWFDSAQNLHLELDETSINSPQSVTPEQRRRLINLLTQIRPWVESGPVTPAVKPSVERPPAPVQIQSPSKAAADVKVLELPPAIKPASIVAQIDLILQANLIGTPWADKAIRLQESPDGGVTVWVGVAHYEGVDAVPDPEIRAIIRQAVADWEKGPH